MSLAYLFPWFPFWSLSHFLWFPTFWSTSFPLPVFAFLPIRGSTTTSTVSFSRFFTAFPRSVPRSATASRFFAITSGLPGWPAWRSTSRSVTATIIKCRSMHFRFRCVEFNFGCFWPSPVGSLPVRYINIVPWSKKQNYELPYSSLTVKWVILLNKLRPLRHSLWLSGRLQLFKMVIPIFCHRIYKQMQVIARFTLLTAWPLK